MTSTEENIFEGCEDKFFSQAEAEYEKERNDALSRAACRVEKRKLMIASDRYLDTLECMQKQAEETEQKIGGMFESVARKLDEDVNEIQNNAEKALRTIKNQSIRTEKIVKLTSKQHRFRFASLLASAFLCGIIVTVFVYHAFIIGIMNKYLHHTIEIMAQTEIDQAKKEAETILRNANIKADGILKSANTYIVNDETNKSQKKGVTK